MNKSKATENVPSGRCEATVQKCVAAPTAFFDVLPEGKGVSKELALAWKAEISAKNAASTVNVMLSAVNRFFSFMSWDSLRVRRLKTQRRIYRNFLDFTPRKRYNECVILEREAGKGAGI